MSSPGYADQDRYFYGRVWTKPLMIYLLQELLIEKQRGDWRWNRSNTSAIMNVMTRMDTHFQNSPQVQATQTKVLSLRSRYKVFKHVISTHSVWWDREENVIYASSYVWEELIQTHPLAMAFVFHDNPLYDVLKALFKKLDCGGGSRSCTDVTSTSELNLITVSSEDDEDNEDEVIQIQ